MNKSRLIALALMVLAFAGVTQRADAMYGGNLQSVSHSDRWLSYSGSGLLTLDRPVAASGLDTIAAANITGLTFTIDGRTFGLRISKFTLVPVQFLNGALYDITSSGFSTDNYVSLFTTAMYSYYDMRTGHGSNGVLTATRGYAGGPRAVHQGDADPGLRGRRLHGLSSPQRAGCGLIFDRASG